MINDIIDRALELEGAAREAYLEEACGSDIALREKVNQLIGVMSVDVPAAFMQDPLPVPEFTDIADVFASRGSCIQAGQHIGVYRIIEQIGFGGMGEVYLAERDDGEFEQRVAIKVVKAGMGTDEVLRRFHYERQILANLEHPNIARLLFGGISGEGQPYFVMEYVEGESITEYCDRKRLSVRERLKLFKTVCDAVRHAQRNLVVHRDLKPGNILVTDDGVVKLLDFGIAKLLEADSDPITAFHTTGRLGPFTPAYAAPEQVLGKPINAGTDVYALGVILYELLTGRRPYQLERGGGLLPENVRLICEKVPTVPSSVATRRHLNEEAAVPYELSEKRGVEPVRLKRALQGDLDAIVMKALKKEPERRYASAGELSVDLDSYLANKPVSAQNDSWRYRGFKFVQRHKVPVGAIAIAVLALVGGLMAAIWQADLKEEQALTATTTVEYLQSIFSGVDPDIIQGDSVLAVDLLLDGIHLLGELEDQPLVKANIIRAIGVVLSNLSSYQEADSLFAAGISALEQSDLLIRRQRELLARLYFGRGQTQRTLESWAEAERLFNTSLDHLDALRQKRPLFRAQILNELALLMSDQIRPAEAERFALEAIGYVRVSELKEKNIKEEDRLLVKAIAQERLAYAYNRQNKLLQARESYEEALFSKRELLGKDHPKVGHLLVQMSYLFNKLGDWERSEEYLNTALDIYRQSYGENHDATAVAHLSLGDVYHFRTDPDLDQAVAHYRHAQTIYERVAGELSESNGIALLRMGQVSIQKEDYLDGEQLLDRARLILEESEGMASKIRLIIVDYWSGISRFQRNLIDDDTWHLLETSLLRARQLDYENPDLREIKDVAPAILRQVEQLIEEDPRQKTHS